MRIVWVTTVIALSLLRFASASFAATPLNFADGNGTALVDQFPGAVGGGWSTPWTVSPGAVATPTVVDTNPLSPDGGNYLEAQLTGINRNLIRQYGNTPEFSVNSPHTISWQWRLDSPFTVTSIEDRINFFAAASPAGTSTSVSNSWTIGVAPQYMGHDNWYFYDRQVDTSFAPANTVNSGIPLVQGTTYSFSVSLNPLNGTYDASVSDGTNRFSQTGLNFRSPSINSNFLHFGGKTTASDRVLDFSLDSVAISGGEPDSGLPAADGFRGIWYSNQSVGEPYAYKYSGGFGTYPQQHKPQAHYSAEANKTFFTYGGTNASNSDLYHIVSYYDHATSQVARPRILLSKGTTDAHDNPTLNVDDEGYVYIFSNSHGGARPAYIHRSTEPHSIDQFEQVLALPRTNNFSYSQPLYVEEIGFMFMHTQYTSSGRTLKFNTSADGVNWDHDWETRPTIAQMPGGQYQVSEVHGRTVGTMFNYHPGGNVNARTNLYYMQTTDMGTTWTTADGTLLTTPVTTVTNAALVHDYAAEGRLVYLKDVQYDSSGNPVLMYLTSNDWKPGPTGNPRTWHIAHHKNGEWDIKDIFTSDHNYDFGSLYIEADGTWRVIAPTADGPQPWGTGGDMVLWLSDDEGETWEATRQLTHDSQYNHTFARRPVNADDDFYAFWADGSPLEETESRFYFTDREGTGVWRMPWTMEGDFATPELAFTPILLVPLDGDFNGDGKVDAADYTVWRDELGSTYNEEHYDEWRENYGATAPGSGSGENLSAVPEPAAWMLMAGALLFLSPKVLSYRRRAP